MDTDYFMTEYRERRKFKRTVIAAAICGGLAILAVIIYLLCRYVIPAEKISEIYTDKLFYYITWPLKKAVSYFPFSIAEVALYACIAAVLISFIRMIVKIIRGIRMYYIQKKKGLPVSQFPIWRPAVQFGLKIGAMLCAALAAFILFGGLNYTSLTFSEKAGYVLEENDVGQLRQLCELLGGKVSYARQSLELNVNGTINDEYPDYNIFRLTDAALDAYQNLPKEYDSLKKSYPRVKPAISSKLMSNIHITGIYPYILPEAVVNAHTPIMSLPHTICHEMAHQRGFAREDEANYIAYLACINSKNPIFVYSGYYTAFSYAMDQLYLYDKKSWAQISSKINNGVLLDNMEESNFWRQYQTISNEFTSNVNDTYLSVMDVKDGVHSYGKMIDLILAEEKRNGTIK
ncbi:MAG: DUF3810 domain-containing protein [Clostridia bacterium]